MSSSSVLQFSSQLVKRNIIFGILKLWNVRDYNVNVGSQMLSGKTLLAIALSKDKPTPLIFLTNERKSFF